ncbi:MAG TPA: efflux RND transporter permease subunit [Candidatus Hydrogenedentes bacterium]|nr:efflux RND transporter permease subunit [Candidatus Hydrogenedentota bacterium]
MGLTELSLRRPVAMCSLIIGLTILGVNAYRTMPLEFFPKLDLPYLTVIVPYPGATPNDIEIDIAKRVEDAVSSVDGLKHIVSVSMDNMCQVLLEFNTGVDVDVAANDVREKLDLIVNDLPSGADRPYVLKFDVNALPVVTMALTGDLSREDLFDYADNELKDRLTAIPGVAEVQLIGGAEREVHVLLDRDKLAATGLTSLQVVEAIQKGVLAVPAGRIRDAGSEYNVRFDAESQHLDDLGDLVIRTDQGARVYLRDVARVEMTTAEFRQIAELDGKPAISIRLVKKADANAVDVVNRTRAAVEQLRRELPGGTRLEWVEDYGSFVQASVDSATANVYAAVALTALILFLFLYNIRSTFIVAVTMPLTVLIGLFFIAMAGFSLNTSTLLAISLSTGILVTNSIVVLESIVSRLNELGDPREAARLGAKDVGVAVLASAGTNVVVLFPIATMGAQVGQFFAPFAWTMVILTVVSLFISFTLTPILSARFLRVNRSGLLALLDRGWNGMLGRLAGVLVRFLRFLEHNRLVSASLMVLVVALFTHALKLGKDVGFTFFPEADRGVVFIKLEYPTRYSLENTRQRVAEVLEKLSDVPDRIHTLTTIGKVEGVIGMSNEGVNLAQILVTFPQRTEREKTLEDYIAMVKARLEGYADAIVTVTKPATIGGQASDVEVDISGDDLQRLESLALALQQSLRARPEFRSPDTSVRIGKPEIRVRPDRVTLSDLNLPAYALGFTLRGNLEGIKAAVYKEQGRNYDIVVKMEDREGLDQVGSFPFPGMPGQGLTLEGLGNVEDRMSPVRIIRKDKTRISKLFCNLDPKYPLGTAVEEIRRIMTEDIGMPVGYRLGFPGRYEIMEESNAAFANAGLIAVVLVYLTLAAILESFFLPWLIMLTLPLGLIGVIWALWLAGEAFSLMALLGLVMLIGIVVNNAILIMESARAYRERGGAPHEAMLHATADQFRPIVMITLAAVLGMVPVAFDRGIGAEVRVAIGIISIGGVMVSAVLTLLVIPMVYDFFTRDRKRRRGEAG